MGTDEIEHRLAQHVREQRWPAADDECRHNHLAHEPAAATCGCWGGIVAGAVEAYEQRTYTFPQLPQLLPVRVLDTEALLGELMAAVHTAVANTPTKEDTQMETTCKVEGCTSQPHWGRGPYAGRCLLQNGEPHRDPAPVPVEPDSPAGDGGERLGDVAGELQDRVEEFAGEPNGLVELGAAVAELAVQLNRVRGEIELLRREEASYSDELVTRMEDLSRELNAQRA